MTFYSFSNYQSLYGNNFKLAKESLVTGQTLSIREPRVGDPLASGTMLTKDFYRKS